MDTQALIDEVRRKICHEVDVVSEGLDRYIVHTPFTFEDGDHYVIYLHKHGNDWLLTDEGHTLMHLSYSGTDIFKGKRGKIVDESLAYHGVENREGVLQLAVPSGRVGDSLYSFLQAITKTASVTKFTKDVVRTAFFDDFKQLIAQKVPEGSFAFDWTDTVNDPNGLYPVDCRIEATKPWFIFAINTSFKCKDAVIACYRLEKCLQNFNSLAIFEDQTEIERRPLAQLTDVIGKQFSSLDDRARIHRFIEDEIMSPN